MPILKLGMNFPPTSGPKNLKVAVIGYHVQKPHSHNIHVPLGDFTNFWHNFYLSQNFEDMPGTPRSLTTISLASKSNLLLTDFSANLAGSTLMPKQMS